jgi:ABC-2 type transport system permease protein/sodium transport system permease protein
MNEGPLYAPPPDRLSLSAALARLGRLAHKELSETLRDRRTIVTLLLMPVLLYTMLSLVLWQLAPHKLLADSGPRYRLGFRTAADIDRMVDWLNQGGALLIREGSLLPPPNARMSGPQPPPPSALPWPELDIRLTEDLEGDVLRGHLDVGVRPLLPRPAALAADAWSLAAQAPCSCAPAAGLLTAAGAAVTADSRTDAANARLVPELVYLEESATACEAVRHIQRLYNAARLGALERRLKIPHVSVHQAPVARGGRPRPSAFLVLMPLILILMTVTGAVYPAIDLTAGERERGTLEILMAAPVPRLSLLLAKYVAVVTVAMLTALMNLGGMAVTVWVSGLFRGDALSPLVLLQIFLLLLLFAAFFSAVLLALTSFARSFKEAQAYLIPLMLVALVPGVLSLVPGLRLDGPLALVPLLNIVLLARDLLLGEAGLWPAVCVIASTLVYALAAIAVAALIFGAQAVGSDTGGWWGRRRADRALPGGV